MPANKAKPQTQMAFPSPRFHLIEQSLPLVQWIDSCPESDLDLRGLLAVGCVYLNHKRIQPEQVQDLVLAAQDIVRIHPQPKRYKKPFVHFQDLIREETEEFFVVVKPSGVPVHPTLDNLYENLLSWGKQDLKKDLFITHRLDVGTSGLMVYAKSGAAQARFNGMLRKGLVQKVYQAESEIREPAGGSLVPKAESMLNPWVHWMKPSYRAPKELQAEEFPEGIRCESRPLSLEITKTEFGRKLVVDLELVTGRTHQIRAQMGFLGWPISGDQLYGSEIKFEGPDQWKLQCIRLQFRVGEGSIQITL